jgi:hypothetical protein
MGCLRVHKIVELRNRAGVSGNPKCTTHGNDAPGFPKTPGIFPPGLREIRQRPKGNNRETLSKSGTGTENFLDGITARGPGQTGNLHAGRDVAQPVRAVNLGRRNQSTTERFPGPFGNPWGARRPDKIENSQHVARAFAHTNVPRDCRDGLKVKLGRAQGEDQSEGVVNAGVGIYENV